MKTPNQRRHQKDSNVFLSKAEEIIKQYEKPLLCVGNIPQSEHTYPSLNLDTVGEMKQSEIIGGSDG